MCLFFLVFFLSVESQKQTHRPGLRRKALNGASFLVRRFFKARAFLSPLPLKIARVDSKHAHTNTTTQDTQHKHTLTYLSYYKHANTLKQLFSIATSLILEFCSIVAPYFLIIKIIQLLFLLCPWRSEPLLSFSSISVQTNRSSSFLLRLYILDQIPFGYIIIRFYFLLYIYFFASSFVMRYLYYLHLNATPLAVVFIYLSVALQNI